MYVHTVADFLHFRTNENLEALLEQEVTALREAGVAPKLANRSAVARAILTAYLGAGARERLKDKEGRELDGDAARAGLTKAAFREVLGSVSGVAETAVTRATSEVLERLPVYLEEAIAEAVG